MPVMAKSTGRRTRPQEAVATADDRASASRSVSQPAPLDHHAIAHRAFEIYCERGGLHGHDLEDWLQAEDELRRP